MHILCPSYPLGYVQQYSHWSLRSYVVPHSRSFAASAEPTEQVVVDVVEVVGGLACQQAFGLVVPAAAVDMLEWMGLAAAAVDMLEQVGLAVAAVGTPEWVVLAAADTPVVVVAVGILVGDTPEQVEAVDKPTR